MKERPILFSGEMVRAILDGKKTQTRRVMKKQPQGDFADYKTDLGYPASIGNFYAGWFLRGKESSCSAAYYKCPYGQPGDRLWVRETFCFVSEPRTFGRPDNIFTLYRATDEEVAKKRFNFPLKWKPSIFMPRYDSRILLEITDIRVERLQNITEEDAISEGTSYFIVAGKIKRAPMSMRSAFSDLWDSINEKRGYPWDSNPWVWVVEFKPVK